MEVFISRIPPLTERRHKTRRAARIALIAAFAIVAALIFFGDSYRTEQRVEYFSSALRSSRDETVSIGVETFVVRKGIVYEGTTVVDEERSLPALRLAYEKVMARNSPLVALPMVDLIQMQRSVEFLARSQDQLAQRQETMAAASLVKTSLYPIDFLRAAIDAERTRRAFLETGSGSDADAYASAQRRAFAAYERDLRRFRRAFLLAVPEDTPPYVTKSAVIRRSTFLDALDAMDMGMRGTRALFEKRHACLVGRIIDCDPTDLLPPSIESPQMPEIAPPVTARAQEVADIFEESGMTLEHAAPVALSGSECMAEASPSLFSRMVSPGQERASRPMLIPIYLNDITFLASGSMASLPFFAYFKAHDVEYVRVVHFMYYNCPRISRDVSRIYWVRSVRDVASYTPISGYATGTDKERLRILESHLLESSATKEADAAAYVRVAQDTLRSSNVPESVEHTLSELALSYRNRSAGLEQSVFTVANTGIMNAYISLIGGGSEISLPFLFYVRSGVPLLYLADNPSVAGDDAWLLEKSNLPESEQPGMRYSQLPHSPDFRARLVHDFSFYNALHREAATAGASRR